MRTVHKKNLLHGCSELAKTEYKYAFSDWINIPSNRDDGCIFEHCPLPKVDPNEGT